MSAADVAAEVASGAAADLPSPEASLAAVDEPVEGEETEGDEPAALAGDAARPPKRRATSRPRSRR